MAERFVSLTPRIGAKVLMRREEIFDPAAAEKCLEALERYGVLVFPQIDLSDEEQIAFSENLGQVIPMGPMRPDGSHEVIFKVTLDPREQEAAEYLRDTIGWHMDGLHDDGPLPRATLLSARRLSPTGGQTEFCNTYAAYDDLSEQERMWCESLRVLHTLEATKRHTSPNATSEEVARYGSRRSPKTHPLVWHHLSGRKSLIFGISVDHVLDVPEAESREIIERLWAHATRRENVYRHQWTLGDLVIWDNHGVMHRVIPYDPNSGRMMHRTTLYGEEQIRGSSPSITARG